jgi:hypothetical protein
MKIYTEVNYKWLDGQLVKTDSKSFEYDGEVTLCGPGGGGGGGTLGDLATGATKIADDTGLTTLVETGANLGDTAVANIEDGVGALTEVVTDTLSGGADAASELAQNNPIAPPPETVLPMYDPSIKYDKWGMVIEDLGSQVTNVVTDPLGTATTVLGNTGDALQDVVGVVSDPILEGMQTGGQVAGDNLNDALGIVTGGLGDITEGTGIGGSTLDILTGVGGGLDDIMEPVNETVWDAMGGINTSIADGLDLITGPFKPKGGGPKVELEKMKSRKGRLKNRNIAKLRVNKSKGRARQSLRIG